MKIWTICAAVLLAGSAGALEINDVYDVNVASGASQTISEAITGSGSIRKTGAGTLVLSGANTFTGGVSVEAGRVEVAATEVPVASNVQIGTVNERIAYIGADKDCSFGELSRRSR